MVHPFNLQSAAEHNRLCLKATSVDSPQTAVSGRVTASTTYNDTGVATTVVEDSASFTVGRLGGVENVTRFCYINRLY